MTKARLVYPFLLSAFTSPLPAETKSYTAQLANVDIAQLKLKGVKVERAEYKGKAALRVSHIAGEDGKSYAILPGTMFQDGVIELDLAGDVAPGVGEGARGFTGIAFRMSADASRYECIYVRPANGRAGDQERRNHTVQYISMPEFTWRRLRAETPFKYETYADMVLGEWNHVKIDVRGEKARLFVNNASQPTLIVNDLKQGLTQGAIALWVDVGTVAHFANLQVQP